MVGLSGPGRRHSSRCRSDSVTPNTPAMTAREPTSPRPARLKVPMSGSVGCGPDCHHQMPRAIASTVNTTMASTIQRRRARRPRSCDGCASGSASSGGTGPIRLTCWPWSGSTLSRCGSWSGPPGTSQARGDRIKTLRWRRKNLGHGPSWHARRTGCRPQRQAQHRPLPR